MVFIGLSVWLRENKSTCMAFICLIDMLVSAIEKTEIVVGLFMDLNAAFDITDRILLWL